MKDPAILFFYDTWLTATAEMDADVRTWYLELLIHCYDKKSIPNDTEKLASLARVKFSDYEKFKQVLEHLLKHKFKQMEDGRLVNDFVCEVMRKREQFKEKRTRAGIIGSIIKVAKNTKGFNFSVLEQLKEVLFSMSDEDLNKHKDKQVLEHLLKLYINGDGDGDINSNKNGGVGEELNIAFDVFWNLYEKKVGDKEKCQKIWAKLKDEERTKIIETLPAFKQSISDKKFQPYPKSYLNSKRWNDELTMPTKFNNTTEARPATKFI